MQGGFSIREYTSRMRSINAVKCWPFDESCGEETVKSLLPPIVVKRFTWWFDELQLLYSEAAEKKTKKVFEKGETSSRNAHRDLEGEKVVRNKSLKGKTRATKKRSILEIFAVAPPIKRAVSSDEEDSSHNSSSRNVGISRARKKKKMKNTDSILRKALRAVKKIKRKKAAEKRGDEIGVPDKEHCFKFKLHAQEKATGNSRSSCCKESDNDIDDCVSKSKRKPILQDLRRYKKFPMRGILKDQSKEFPLKQSKKCFLQKTVQLNSCSALKANKHVTFSDNDELLRPSSKPSQSAECFDLQKDCTSDIGSVDCVVAVRKYSTSSESSGSESNEQLTMFNVDSTIMENQNYEKECSTKYGSLDRSVMYRVNQQWSDHDLRDAPHNTMDASSGFLHMPSDERYNSKNIKVITTSSNTTSGRTSREDLGTCCKFPPRCFEDYLRTHNDASMSHLSNMKRTYKVTQACSENTAINCASSLHFQTFPRLSPNELLQNFCSIQDGSTNGITEEFVGLPLNSQGELITLNSSSQREVNQLMNSNGLYLPSSAVSKYFGHHPESRNLDSKTLSRGQLNLFPMENYLKENDMLAIPSRLGITESQCVNANWDFDFPDINYNPFHNSEKTICRGHNQLQNGPENERCHSTMRLMGKEFKVGGRDVQGFEDGYMWKDKQIIDEIQFQTQPSFGDFRETLFCPTVNHRSESKYALPHFDCRTQISSTHKSLFLRRTVDSPNLSPGTHSEVYNSKSMFSEPFATGYDSRFFTLELPKPSAPHPNIQLKSKQNLHYSPVSAIKFPFMHPDLEGNAASTWARRSSLIQQPLCFDISENATRLSNSQSYTLGSALQSVAPAPLTTLPYYSGLLPVSSMQRKLGNQNKIKEMMKSRIGIRDLSICKKSKAQLSTLSNAHFKPLKRPALGFPEELQYAVRTPAACVSFDDRVRNREDAFGSCSATQHSRFVMSEYEQTNKDAQTQTILPFVDSYIETARTGSIKLTAGSKHILTARQQQDQDMSLSATNIGFRFS